MSNISPDRAWMRVMRKIRPLIDSERTCRTSRSRGRKIHATSRRAMAEMPNTARSANPECSERPANVIPAAGSWVAK
jgi:hypothetical protein